MHAVVGVHSRDEFTAASVESYVQAFHDAGMGTPKNPDAGVPRFEISSDFQGSVGGPVVDEDAFPVGLQLSEQAVEAGG